MQARVNGEAWELPGDATVSAVVERLCAERLAAGPRGIAVALNGEVVPRSAWAKVRVAGGDEIEVVGVSAGG